MSRTRIINRLAKKLGLFRRDQRGNVAVIVGAAIIPLVGALGLATDTARSYLVKARLSQALDAAALAGGKVYFSTQRDADIKKYFAANFPSASAPIYDAPYTASFMNANVVLSSPVNGGVSGKENLTLKAKATIPTTFMRILGFDTVTVDATSQVTRAISALDVVISMDWSGSMASPGTKITSARDAAVTFVDAVFGTNSVAPTLTVDGTTYNLLNMGFVPWNSKVNLTTQGQTFTTVTTQTVPQFTNPVTGQRQTTLYYANNSEVPLLNNPNDLPGGWSGCIYARYLGDAYNDNDADTVRGTVTMGSGTGQRQWLGWEPMASDDSEPQSGNWSNADGPSGTRWVNSTTWKTKNCNNAYFLDIGTTNYDNAQEPYTDTNGNGTRDAGEPFTDKNGNGTWDAGSIKTSPSPYTTTNSSRPLGVPNPQAAAGSTYTSGGTTKKYSGFLKFIDPSKSYLEPGSVASYASNPGSTDCTNCLSKGVVPLTNVKATIRNKLTAITTSDPTGNTNLEQGLYWAWEMLMPGVPFNEAVATVPFKRIRAIVILTDGEQVGGAGDAYKGRFGFQEGAGVNDDPDHGTITINGPAFPQLTTPEVTKVVQNNLDNRARQLADHIKAEGIRLYVIGFDLAGNTHALTFLQDIASPADENGTYLFDAPSPSDLDAVFKQIAASLSNLRVSM